MIKDESPVAGCGKLSSKVSAVQDIDLELAPCPKGVVRHRVIRARGETGDRETDAREEE